tara:strand:+ start:76 stop:579 length:504 start_codon:yes stop_codon:yes gene_type:complete
MKRSAFCALALLVSTSGCATFSPLTTHRYIGDSGGQWLTYDSTRRGTLIVRSPDGKIRSCAEPAPDTAYSFNNAVKANVESGGTTAGGELTFAATVLALAGRDNLVLLARDAMFRLCEASANGTIDQAQYKELYMKVLDQVTNIATASSERSKALESLMTNQLRLTQ